MPRPRFLPRGSTRVARWRVGDEVYYQRAAFARWQKAKVLKVFFDDTHTTYRIEIDNKIYLARENQLGYPIRRKA